MNLKPPRWNVSPALIAREAQSLWNGLAFVAPLWGHAGKGALLNCLGQPLAGANLTAGSTLQWRGTPYGLGFGRTGTGATLILSQNNLAPITTSNGTGTGDFTFVLLANPVAEAVITVGGGQSVDGGNSARMEIQFNANTGGSATSGAALLYTRDTASGFWGVQGTGAIDGDYHLFAGRRIGTIISIWRDGLQLATASSAARDIFVSGTSDFALGSVASTGALAIKDTTNIVFAAGWNRALTGAEMRMLARDPFIMFRPALEWRGVWTALDGGAGAVSLAPLAVSGAGKVIFKGSSAVSLAPMTVSGAGKERFTATGVISLSPLTASTSGKEIFTATGALTLRSLSVTGAGSHTVAGVTSGAGAISLAPMSVSGVGRVILKGSGTISLTPAGVSATGKELFKATGAVNLAPAAVSSTGKESFKGAGAVSLAPFTASGVGKEILGGAASIFLRPLSVVGSGIGGATPAATYAVEIVIQADAREIIVLDDQREIVVN